MAATGGTEEGLDWEFGVSKYKPVYRACIDSEVLLCGPEDYIQYPVINYNGKEYEKECACVCVYIYIYQERQWHPTPVLLPGESQGRRSLVGFSPWGR